LPVKGVGVAMVALAWVACDSPKTATPVDAARPPASASSSSRAPHASASAPPLTKPSRADAAPVPLDGGPQLVTCEARNADNRTALAMLSGCPSCVAQVMAFAGECKRDPLGTWMVAVTNPALDTLHGAPTGYGFTFKIVREPPCPDSGPCAAAGESEEHAVSVDLTAKEPPRWTTFDYDHDGVPEVLFAAGNEGGVVTARKPSPAPPGAAGTWAVEAYKPASLFASTGFEDVDHDGRPDLHTTGGYPGPAMFVAHSLPDGTFSQTDDVAKAAFAAACPKAGEELTAIPTTEPADLMRRIACARARGQSPADVVAALAPLRVRNANVRGAARDGGLPPATVLPMLVEAAANRAPAVKLP